jgi:hypothetical protein
MRGWSLPAILGLAIAIMALVAGPTAQAIVLTGYFTDDNGSTFESDIDSIAEAGITKGCNPPANTHFCPNDDVTRGEMAAFIRRALDLPAAGKDYFTDDNGSTFEGDINAIAAAGITKGCNPPANSRYCPTRRVSRGEMAAFIRRGLDLPPIVQTIPIGSHSALSCSKDGQRCSLTVDLSAGQPYLIEEGIFQVVPATPSEQMAFNASNSGFTLSLDGSDMTLSELAQHTGGGVITRRWQRTTSFSSGTHTLVARWRWAGQSFQTNTITIRASG